MKAKLCLLLVAFGQVCAVAMAQVQPAAVISPSSVGGGIYITHVTVIDTETGKEAQDRTVVISGERISEVRDGKAVKLAAGVKVVDGTGKYLIPGLWDMHAGTKGAGTTLESLASAWIGNVRCSRIPPWQWGSGKVTDPDPIFARDHGHVVTLRAGECLFYEVLSSIVCAGLRSFAAWNFSRP